MSPKMSREVILENFEELNGPETSTSDKPESVRVLKNRKVVISPDTPITKYNSLTFSYFSNTFLYSISIEILFKNTKNMKKLMSYTLLWECRERQHFFYF